MEQGIKYTVILSGIIAAGLSLVFGVYLPFAKAQLYVSNVGAVQNVHSVQEFEDLFNRGFNFYSPIGDEETAKFLGSDTLRIISEQKDAQDQSEVISRALVAYVEPHLLQYPNPRHLIIVAAMHEILWRRFRRAEDLSATEAVYKRILTTAPKLPPPLYGLMQAYLESNDRVNAKVIGTRILKLWPNDMKMQSVMKQL